MYARAQSASEHQGSAELRRIPIPRTRVNKGNKKDRSQDTPAPQSTAGDYSLPRIGSWRLTLDTAGRRI
jgi:hypothetical protein